MNGFSYTVNQANAILPAGDVRIGPKDFNIYTNSQFPTTAEIDRPWREVAGLKVHAISQDYGLAERQARL